MLTSIDDWPSVYRALKQRAEAMRGAVELHVGTADHVRWPRTTGADVVAISAVVDQHVRRLRATYGKHTLIFRWRTCLQDIARLALSAPGNDLDCGIAGLRLGLELPLSLSSELTSTGYGPSSSSSPTAKYPYRR